MGNIGDAFTQVIPAVGTAGTGYASTINDILTEVMTRLSSRIPYSSLLNNSDIDLNGQAILNAGYMTLADGSALAASPINRLSRNAAGNLFWQSATGAVQLTTGASINVSSAGGITGDYGTGPEQFYFDNASQTYKAYDDFSTLAWAYIRGMGLEIAPSASSLLRARILFTGAANLSFTLPATIGGTGNQMLAMDDTGLMKVNPSLPNDITFTGTAGIRHASYTHSLTVALGDVSNYSGSPATQTAPGAGTIPQVVLTASSSFQIRLDQIPHRSTLQSVTVHLVNAPAASITYTLRYLPSTVGNLALTSITGAATTSAAREPVITPTTPVVRSAGDCYWLTVATGVGSAILQSITLAYTT